MNYMSDKPIVVDPWAGFSDGEWRSKVDVRGFIQENYTPYEGDDAFLANATERTKKLWDELGELLKEERKAGVLDVSAIPSSITAHDAGYINKELELIVGLQTDAPLKRAIMPNGGLRMVENGMEAFGFKPDPQVHEIWTKYRKDHNQAVFDAYSPDIMAARKSGVVTGLPDAYGRGRIIGDYRRVALYGIDFLKEQKRAEKTELDDAVFDMNTMRAREELPI